MIGDLVLADFTQAGGAVCVKPCACEPGVGAAHIDRYDFFHNSVSIAASIADAPASASSRWCLNSAKSSRQILSGGGGAGASARMLHSASSTKALLSPLIAHNRTLYPSRTLAQGTQPIASIERCITASRSTQRRGGQEEV